MAQQCPCRNIAATISSSRHRGGREPLTWLVNGRLIGSFDRFAPITVTPDGEGVARITVVDASGRSDTSQVRFKHMN